MKSIRTSFILGLLLFWAAPVVLGEYSSPTGLWDVRDDTRLIMKFAGRKVKTRPQSVNSLVQFKDGKVFTSYDWSNIPGVWKAKSKAKYAIKMDIARINGSGTVPAYLNRLVNDFNSAATGVFGQAPSIKRIKLKSFTDTGKLIGQGLQLRGNTTIEARIEYVNPLKQRTAVAKLKTVATYQASRASAPSACCTSNDSAQNLADSQAFLASNAALPGIQQTASGLQYKIISQSDGVQDHPAATDTVMVSYVGILPSGQIFDANSGVSFPLGGVIAGWTEGLQLMQVGDHFRFYIPPELAYGNRSVGQYIKPNTALVFDVVLLTISQ
jgi:FKBP-type peptidyl-prolyl cis-trans isomerase